MVTDAGKFEKFQHIIVNKKPTIASIPLSNKFVFTRSLAKKRRTVDRRRCCRVLVGRFQLPRHDISGFNSVMPLGHELGAQDFEVYQITSLGKFVRTWNKNFLDTSTRNQRNYFPKTVNTDDRRGGGSCSREPQGERFSGYRARLHYNYRISPNLLTVRSESRVLHFGPTQTSLKN